MIERRDVKVFSFDIGDFVLAVPSSTLLPLEGRSPAEAEPVLKASGALEPVNRRAVEKATGAPSSIRAVNLNLTPECHLACRYCYAGGGDYDGAYSSRMSLETALAGCDMVDRGPSPYTGAPRVELFGGEPLLCHDTIKALAENCDGLLFRVSTGLARVPEEGLSCAARVCRVVSVAVDGGRVSHNALRPLKSGGGSFDEVISAVRNIRNASSSVRIVARMTLTGGTQGLSAGIEELLELDLFDYFSLYALAPDSPVEADEARIEEDLEALAKVYPSLVGRGRFRGVLEVEALARCLVEGRVPVRHCGAGITYFSLAPDGRIFPCHRLSGRPEFVVGDLEHGIRSDLAPWRTPVWQRETCKSCWNRFLCAGGCLYESLVAGGDLLAVSRGSCAFAKSLSKVALRSIVDCPERLVHTRRQVFAELDDFFVFCGMPTVSTKRTIRVID